MLVCVVIGLFTLVKVEVPIVDHLSIYAANGEQYEVMEIFPM